LFASPQINNGKSHFRSNDTSGKSKSTKVATSSSVGGGNGSVEAKNRKVSWADQDEDLITLVDDIRGKPNIQSIMLRFLFNLSKVLFIIGEFILYQIL
jgi:hypothetical protein